MKIESFVAKRFIIHYLLFNANQSFISLNPIKLKIAIVNNKISSLVKKV